MKTCFYTVTSLEFYETAQGCYNSVQKFYPDIPYFIKKGYTDPLQIHETGKALSEEFERVIQINADCIMCQPCPILFEDYDIGIPLNNYPTDEEIEKGAKPYLNIGVFVVTNPSFWDEFIYQCKTTGYMDQNVANNIFFDGKYKTKILQDDEMSYGIHEMPEYSRMQLINGDLYVGNKKLAIFHAAGYEWKTEKEGKIDFSKIINEEARTKLQSYIKGELC